MLAPQLVPHLATAVDWPRVRRARFDVRHHYRYAYREPITHLRQRLVMTPPDRHADQVLLDHGLQVTGAGDAPAISWEADRFGNRVASVSVPRVSDAVTFESAYRVERVAPHPAAPASREHTPAQLAAFLETTALTAPDARIAAAAALIRRDHRGRDDDDERLADRAHDWVVSAMTYQVGVTGLQTPAAMALHLGRGVCQDFAHILLSVLRALGIPARYVSGHLIGEGVPHAWVEAFVRRPRPVAFPDAIETIAYDPTHHRRAGMQYVTVAVGRDFADVTPTSGTFTGASAGTMSWGKRATLVDVEYAA
jgi:transglutaminase-like putative cysteine protease